MAGGNRGDERRNPGRQRGGAADHEPARAGHAHEGGVTLELGGGLPAVPAVMRPCVLHAIHVRQYSENSIRFQ
jgi:hypothetical protein